MASIENLDNFILKINNLEQVLNVGEVMEEACLLVENTAKMYCPVDTGQLRNSITHMVTDNVGYIGTNVKYAPYVEFGTGVFAKDGNGRQTPWSYYDTKEDKWIWTKGQHPNPFLERALTDNKEVIARLFGIYVERELVD